MTEQKNEQKTRITKARLQEFIEDYEHNVMGDEDAVPECWQALRQYAGLEALTRDDILLRDIAALEKIVKDAWYGTDVRQAFAQLIKKQEELFRLKNGPAHDADRRQEDERNE